MLTLIFIMVIVEKRPFTTDWVMTVSFHKYKECFPSTPGIREVQDVGAGKVTTMLLTTHSEMG